MPPLAAALAALAAAAAGPPAGTAPPLAALPQRLQVNGSRVLLPDGSPTQLRGFDWYYTPVGGCKWVEPTDGRTIKSLLPQTNLIRSVLVHWWDSAGAASDCFDSGAPGYLKPQCVEGFDKVIQWATGAGLWTTITVRSSIGAGGNGGPHVFTNATLRGQLFTVWRFLAARYATVDRIAAYEILSEPRMIPPGQPLGPSLAEFYEEGTYVRINN